MDEFIGGAVALGIVILAVFGAIGLLSDEVQVPSIEWQCTQIIESRELGEEARCEQWTKGTDSEKQSK